MDYLERVASDPAMRRALQAARSWGVRPSEFMGDPVVTVNHLDPGGRVVRSERAGWSREDLEWALALDAYEARLCPRGHDTTVSMEKAHTWDWRAPAIGACHACHAQDVEAERWKGHSRAGSMLYAPAHLEDDCEFCKPRDAA